MNKTELLEYFKSPNKQNWNQEQIQEFWSRLREYRKEYLYDFRDFVFPKFEMSIHFKNNQGKITLGKDANFWFENEAYQFDSHVYFDFAVFCERAYFPRCTFEGGVSFHNSFFLDEADFRGCVFNEQAVYRHCLFKGKTIFSETKFQKNFVLESSSFEGDTFFNHIESKSLFKLSFVTFSYIELNSSVLNSESIFSNVKINDEFEFIGNSLKKLTILKCKFSESNRTTIQDINKQTKTLIPNFQFIDTVFNQHVAFRRVDLSKSVFHQCNFSNASFSECFSSRKSMINEQHYIEKNNYEALSDIYREFKRNFENTKDWELSDRAYVREMIMKQKHYFILAKERCFFSFNSIDWLLYKIYYFVSGFNRSYTRPLVLLIFTSMFLFPILYSIFENDNLKDSMIKSLGSSIPFFFDVTDSVKYDGWGLHSSQSLISAILMAFFLIALRRRFRT